MSLHNLNVLEQEIRRYTINQSIIFRFYLNETELGQCWSELFHAQTLPEWDQTRTVVIRTVSCSDFTWMRPNSDSGDPNCFTLIRLYLNETKLGQCWSELFQAQTLPEWDQTPTVVIRTVSDSGDMNCFTIRLYLNETKLRQRWSELFPGNCMLTGHSCRK